MSAPDDLGRAYLYEAPATRQGRAVGAANNSGSPTGTLRMAALPGTAMQTTQTDWGAAIGNLENAKLALDTLKSLVSDAVFLDEEAFSNASALSMYQQRIQLQQRRIRDLEHEVEALRNEIERKDENLKSQILKNQQVAQQVQDLQSELENNAVVFNMHYQELINRNEEIDRLKAVIEGMDTGHLT